MSVVTYFVETAGNYLDSAAETQFGSVAATVGTLIVISSTLLVILVFINMAFQYRSMDGRTAFWLALKITLVGIFATNWVQFNSFSSAALNGICQTSCPLISCGVSDFRGAVFVFGVEPDWSSRLPVSGFA